MADTGGKGTCPFERDRIMKGSFFFFTLAAILLITVTPHLQAQQPGNIKFGNLSVIPGIAAQGIYDDNIYMGNGRHYADDPAKTTAEKKESDWITHVKPSLLLNYLMPERGYVNLGYQGDFAFYNKNTANNWKNNQGNLDVNYQAPGGLIAGVAERYTRSEDPFGGADQYNIGRITKRWTNDVKTKFGFTIAENFRSLLYFNNYKQKYDNAAFDYSQDYTDSEYGIGAEVRILPKTWGFLRYHYGIRNYDTNAPGQTDEFNSAGKWHRVSTGLTWDPGAKLSGELNLGYQWKQYDHVFTDATQTIRRNDENTWVAATSVTFQATETTNLGMNLSRAVRNTASDTKEQFIDTGIGLTLQQKLLAKLSFNAGFTYSRNEYNLPVGHERADNNYLANIGLEYNIQEWLGVGVSYNYNRKDSSIETSEFVDNQFMTSLRIVY
jgi:hypothetical protein